jgi:hypothetical protein
MLHETQNQCFSFMVIFCILGQKKQNNKEAKQEYSLTNSLLLLHWTQLNNFEERVKVIDCK